MINKNLATPEPCYIRSKIFLLLVVIYPLLFPRSVSGQTDTGQTGSIELSCGAVEGDLGFISNEETLLRILPGGLQEKYIKDLEEDNCQKRAERVKSIQGAFLAQGWQDKQTGTQSPQASQPTAGTTAGGQQQGVAEVVAGFFRNLFNITIGKLGFLNFIRFEVTPGVAGGAQPSPTPVKDDSTAFKESVDSLKKSICPGGNADCVDSLQLTR